MTLSWVHNHEFSRVLGATPLELNLTFDDAQEWTRDS